MLSWTPLSPLLLLWPCCLSWREPQGMRGTTRTNSQTLEKGGDPMKDHIRDYATAAFRFWARWQGRENYVNYLLDDLQKQKGTGPCSPTEAALIHKERLIRERHAEIADLDAAEKIIDLCQRHYPDIYRAVEMVYLQSPQRELEWGGIKERVHHAELTIPASESTVYRYLRKARLLFAEERGLRI